MLTDEQLLRFLRAREFNVKKAAKMLREDIAWRRDFVGKKYRLTDFPTLVRFHNDGLVRYGGQAADGRPIVVLVGRHFFPRQVTDTMEVVYFFIYYMEKLVRFTEECGFTEFTAIGDLEGWSIRHNFSLSVSKVLAGLLQTHYPERLRYAFVVNNPWAFTTAWNLISPFLEERVKAKVHVWGHDLSKLQRYIDKGELEQTFGGEHPDHPVPDRFVKAVLQPDAAIQVNFGMEIGEPEDWELEAAGLKEASPDALEDKNQDGEDHIRAPGRTKEDETIAGAAAEAHTGTVEGQSPDALTPKSSLRSSPAGGMSRSSRRGMPGIKFSMPSFRAQSPQKPAVQASGMSTPPRVPGKRPKIERVNSVSRRQRVRQALASWVSQSPKSSTSSATSRASAMARSSPHLDTWEDLDRSLLDSPGPPDNERDPLAREFKAGRANDGHPPRTPTPKPETVPLGTLTAPVSPGGPPPRRRITVLGASGRTGLMVVRRALDCGLDVTAFARSLPGQPPSPGVVQLLDEQDRLISHERRLAAAGKIGGSRYRLQVVSGVVSNRHDLDRALEGSSAVVCALGAMARPFGIPGDNQFLVDAIPVLLSAMHRSGVRRLVVVTAALASPESWLPWASWWDNVVSRTLAWRYHYEKLATVERLVREEAEHGRTLDYTFVRPLRLTDGPARGVGALHLREGFNVPGARHCEDVSRADLADLLVEEVVDVQRGAYGFREARVQSPWVGKGVAVVGPRMFEAA